MNQKPKIFVTLPFNFQEADKILTDSGFEVIINEELPLERDVFFRKARGCHGVICYPFQKIDAEFLNFVGNQLKVKRNNYIQKLKNSK